MSVFPHTRKCLTGVAQIVKSPYMHGHVEDIELLQRKVASAFSHIAD